MPANLILGVRQMDYMSGLDDLSTAVDSTGGTAIENWKFAVMSDSQAVSVR